MFVCSFNVPTFYIFLLQTNFFATFEFFMPKRKYVVKYKEFQKRFKAVDNSKGWLSRCQETWGKVMHNSRALKTKFRELKKVIQTEKIARQDFFKKHFNLNQELAESDTKSEKQVTSKVNIRNLTYSGRVVNLLGT